MEDKHSGASAIVREMNKADPEIAGVALHFIAAFAAKGYSIKAVSRDHAKSAVTFSRDGQNPFSFIFNDRDLLFYFRKPAVDVASTAAEILRVAGVNDERTYRVRSFNDALLLVSDLELDFNTIC